MKASEKVSPPPHSLCVHPRHATFSQNHHPLRRPPLRPPLATARANVLRWTLSISCRPNKGLFSSVRHRRRLTLYTRIVRSCRPFSIFFFFSRPFFVPSFLSATTSRRRAPEARKVLKTLCLYISECVHACIYVGMCVRAKLVNERGKK